MWVSAGTRLFKEGKNVDQDYLKTAYEAAHERHSREGWILKKYWVNYKDGAIFKSMKSLLRK